MMFGKIMDSFIDNLIPAVYEDSGLDIKAIYVSRSMYEYMMLVFNLPIDTRPMLEGTNIYYSYKVEDGDVDIVRSNGDRDTYTVTEWRVYKKNDKDKTITIKSGSEKATYKIVGRIDYEMYL